LFLLLTGREDAAVRRRRRTRRGVGIRSQVGAENVIAYLRERQITLTWDQATGTLQEGAAEAITTITGKAS
jgi:hypothetical protein